jgi:16S rRNA (cytosine967-C5)-methyltransferase
VRLTSLYGHAVELLTATIGGSRPADDVIGEFFRARRYLGARDRRFIADTTYAVIRHALRLRYVAGEALKMLDTGTEAVPPVLLIAALAVETSELNPEGWKASLAELWPGEGLPSSEAFLQALESVSLPDIPAVTAERSLSLRHSMPEFVVHDWIRRWGVDEARELCLASNLPAPITLRVNTLRCTREQCAAALRREGLESSHGSVVPESLKLSGRAALHITKPFRDGWCEIQDEGSQLVSRAAGVSPGMVAIDACAGAGGKSLHLAALMENRGRIHAVDVSRRKLKELEIRSRRARVDIITPYWSADGLPPDRLDVRAADVVLIDAPCSGTGTFRRNPWLKLNCTADTVANNVSLQRALLAGWAPLVRPGGRLMYVTCSLLSAENQETMEWFLTANPGFRPAAGVEVTANGPSWRQLLPHRTGTDGFFVAELERQ